MTYFEAYLLTRLDALSTLFEGGIFLGIGIIVFATCPLFWDLNDDYKLGKRVAIGGSVLFLLSSIIVTLIPTTKQAAFIYIAPAIVNNQDIQKTIKKIPELSGLGLEYLGEILKEEIKSTKEEMKKGVKEKINK